MDKKSVLLPIQLYLHFVSASIRAQLQYRYGFIMNILGWAMNYTGMAITMWVMLYSFKALAGWTFWQLLFLFALSVLSWSISLLFFFHFHNLDQYILNGTFDRFLVRPIHPFFHFIAMKFDVGAFGQLLFSIIAFIFAYHQLHLSFSLLQWLVFAGSVLGGVLIQGGILVFISAVAFWTTRSEQLYWVVLFPAKNLMNYPLSIYPRIVQWFLIFVIPFAFVNYFPSLLLLGKTGDFPSFFGFFSPFVGIIFFYLCWRFWMKGLDRYKGTGS
ncbi:ABC transporter permease [Tepidibacillus sp. LV47]|uniref:ABC transporter permease n=1 Tax=Tepidibacillus sp. LV47 TaxID=3398228 RepID=UPI003AB0290F